VEMVVTLVKTQQLLHVDRMSSLGDFFKRAIERKAWDYKDG